MSNDALPDLAGRWVKQANIVLAVGPIDANVGSVVQRRWRNQSRIGDGMRHSKVNTWVNKADSEANPQRKDYGSVLAQHP
jgi:hypothetical protein